jgi:hypothetical protein
MFKKKGEGVKHQSVDFRWASNWKVYILYICRGGSRGGVKSWFFKRNTPKIFAPPSARRNFFNSALPPLTWNPGSAPAYVQFTCTYRRLQSYWCWTPLSIILWRSALLIHLVAFGSKYLLIRRRQITKIFTKIRNCYIPVIMFVCLVKN